jgi:hypothetical protein
MNNPLNDPQLQALFGDAVAGALAAGARIDTPPPRDHWLAKFWDIGRGEDSRQAILNREIDRLNSIINTPENDDFLRGVSIEHEHQRQRWGDAHDRSKSAEQWFFLVGYLMGKALRAAVNGDKEKALHHTISSAAALGHWHKAIIRDKSGAGVGEDRDLRAIADGAKESLR